MRDVKDLCARIEDEIGKIAEKGLSVSNLDTAFKLIDMYKDIKNTEYWDKKSEYYMELLTCAAANITCEGITAAMTDGMLTMITWPRNRVTDPANLKTANARCLRPWRNIWTG